MQFLLTMLGNVQHNEENEMVPNSELSCWEIMQCKNTENCPARQHQDKPCWEIARELDDYRNALKICHDCIVYMLSNGASTFTEQETRMIMKRKKRCVLE